MAENKNIVVNPDGSVTNKDYKEPELSPDQKREFELSAEYEDLVYDMSHPERFTADEMAEKAKRRAELHKILGKDKLITEKGGKMLDAAARMREQMRAKLKQQSGPSLSDVILQQKQNG